MRSPHSLRVVEMPQILLAWWMGTGSCEPGIASQPAGEACGVVWPECDFYGGLQMETNDWGFICGRLFTTWG